MVCICIVIIVTVYGLSPPLSLVHTCCVWSIHDIVGNRVLRLYVHNHDNAHVYAGDQETFLCYYVNLLCVEYTAHVHVSKWTHSPPLLMLKPDQFNGPAMCVRHSWAACAKYTLVKTGLKVEL